jgi:hypothetical protein
VLAPFQMILLLLLLAGSVMGLPPPPRRSVCLPYLGRTQAPAQNHHLGICLPFLVNQPPAPTSATSQVMPALSMLCLHVLLTSSSQLLPATTGGANSLEPAAAVMLYVHVLSTSSPQPLHVSTPVSLHFLCSTYMCLPAATCVHGGGSKHSH